MKIINKISDLKEEINNLSGSIGLVPTMGALHQGHLSLINKSIKDNQNTIVSIFVNPIQFCAGEDLEKYPRTFDSDCRLCDEAGVNIIFAPDYDEVFDDKKDNLTLITPPDCVLDKLCAKSRQGHFAGVCTIVAKLFNLTKANRAYFGQKDAQQLFIIQKMVKDLNFNIEIIPCPIVREDDNLALSSRNKYLSIDERNCALNISKALFQASCDVKRGIGDIETIKNNSCAIMQGLNIEYIEFVDKNTFQIQKEIDKNTMMLIAARTLSTNTRLIDNIILWA